MMEGNPTSPRMVVEVKGLRKSFGGKAILDGFDLEVEEGDFIAITGRSGSGKSTLLNIIGLLDEGDFEGSLFLFDAPAPRPGSRGARMLLREKIAYSFQEPALVEEATVEANLKIAQRYSSTPRTERRSQRESALAEVGLAGQERQMVYQLSGGERQRVALACLRMRPFSLVLADEPTGSLDAENRDAVLGFFDRLAREGKALVVATHDPVVAARATHVVALG